MKISPTIRNIALKAKIEAQLQFKDQGIQLPLDGQHDALWVVIGELQKRIKELEEWKKKILPSDS